jgi:hypothetical protein
LVEYRVADDGVVTGTVVLHESCAPAWNHPAQRASQIGKLLRLLLGTDKDGEAVAALTALKRALTASGLDHHALAAVIERGLSALSISPPVQRTTDDWRSTASFCRAHRDDLTEREAIFIDNLLASYRTLTPKQEKWLYDIEAKLRGARP